jgi:hypothetical protein
MPAWGINQRHDGTMSVWKILCEQETVDALVEMLRPTGCTVDVWADSQTDEQKEERLALLGTQKEGFVFRTTLCPGCSFYDPTSETNCGIDDWDDLFTIGVLEAHAKATEDARQCPEGIPHQFQEILLSNDG